MSLLKKSEDRDRDDLPETRADDTKAKSADAKTVADKGQPRNITQEQIQRFLMSRLQEAKPLGEGLSESEAKAKAKTRAAQMTGMPPRDLPPEPEQPEA